MTQAWGCHHFIEKVDPHDFCCACRVKGLGTDPCAKGQPCRPCLVRPINFATYRPRAARRSQAKAQVDTTTSKSDTRQRSQIDGLAPPSGVLKPDRTVTKRDRSTSGPHKSSSNRAREETLAMPTPLQMARAAQLSTMQFWMG